MALREPQREITETIVGFAIIVPVIILDYKLASFWQAHDTMTVSPIIVYMALIAIIPISIIFLGMISLVGAHIVGESICDEL